MVFHSPLATLLTTACKVLDVVETLLNGPYAPPSPPHHVTYALLLSNFTLLRLVKYPTSSGIDLERATSRLCFGIQLAKKSSVHTSDIFAKMALCLTQLWNSPKAFRNEDGSPDMHVKVFNRLAMGPALDAVWRWYDLFDEQGQISTGRSESHRGASVAKHHTLYLDRWLTSIQEPRGMIRRPQGIFCLDLHRHLSREVISLLLMCLATWTLPILAGRLVMSFSHCRLQQFVEHEGLTV